MQLSNVDRPAIVQYQTKVASSPVFWHTWLLDGGLPDAEVEPDLISMRPEQVAVRMRTWLKYPERAISIRFQSVLTDMIQVLTDLGLQLNEIYSQLSADRFSVIALCDVFAAYDENEAVRIKIRRRRRRDFVNGFFLDDFERRFLLQVFLEWKRTVEYERDIEVLKTYVENTKQALKDAVEANAMHDFLLQFKERLEREVLPALEKCEAELKEAKKELEFFRKENKRLEADLKKTKAELETTKKLLERIERKVRNYVPNVAALGVRLERWMQEALLRFALQSLVLNKLRETSFLFRKLSAEHTDTLKKVEEDAQEMRRLNDYIADLELANSRLEKQLEYNVERKKHFAERTRMAGDELLLQTKQRIAHEHEIRNVLLPRIERILQEFDDYRKEARRREEQLKAKISKLQGELDEMRSKYLFEKREKELYQQRAADFEFQTQQLTARSKVLDRENGAMKRKIATLTKENQQLLLLTQGIGPPVPGGYLCLLCQEDIAVQNRKAKIADHVVGASPAKAALPGGASGGVSAAAAGGGSVARDVSRMLFTSPESKRARRRDFEGFMAGRGNFAGREGEPGEPVGGAGRDGAVVADAMKADLLSPSDGGPSGSPSRAQSKEEVVEGMKMSAGGAEAGALPVAGVAGDPGRREDSSSATAEHKKAAGDDGQSAPAFGATRGGGAKGAAVENNAAPHVDETSAPIDSAASATSPAASGGAFLTADPEDEKR
eukprot:g5334.t1